MAHYAELNEENVVVNVFVGRDEDEVVDGITDWEEYYGNVLNATVKRTSYNTWGNVHYSQEVDENGERIPSEDQSKAFRANYAGKDYSYLPDEDVFLAPEPNHHLTLGTWELNTTNWIWEFTPDEA